MTKVNEVELKEIIKSVPIKPFYEDDAAVIYCADNREILPLFPDKAFDLCLTDPPYGLNEKMQGGTWGTAYRRGDMLEWDYTVDETAIEQLFRISNFQIIWGANNYNMPPSRCWFTWLKPFLPTLSDIELAWTNMDKPAKCYQHPRISIAKGHPTEKPIKLFEWCIQQTNADLILDPFLGSGTTAVAAKILGRKCIGIEISEKYCEIAAKRLSQSVMQLDIPKVEIKQENLFSADDIGIER